MAFSSPLYLDHHHNWHQLQQPNNQQGSGGENPQLTPPPGQPGGGESSIRPGSMVDRARLAKLPLPEAGLNCPRCDSTNTKFCYFNNYSLTQPRHFCKTCRRYWTRGGALRSVPVGGGCRRNKRTKSRSSKSPIKISNPNSSSVSASPSSSEMAGGGDGGGGGGGGHFPQLPLMAALQNLPQYGGGINGSGNISSSIGAFQSQIMAAGGNSQNIDGMSFQIANNSGGGVGAGAGAGGWRLPFLAGFEPQANLFNYQSEGTNVVTPVKEEESRGLNLSRQFLGISENNNQYWPVGNGNNTWAEFSGLNSTSSTTHFL